MDRLDRSVLRGPVDLQCVLAMNTVRSVAGWLLFVAVVILFLSFAIQAMVAAGP